MRDCSRAGVPPQVWPAWSFSLTIIIVSLTISSPSLINDLSHSPWFFSLWQYCFCTEGRERLGPVNMENLARCFVCLSLKQRTASNLIQCTPQWHRRLPPSPRALPSIEVCSGQGGNFAPKDKRPKVLGAWVAAFDDRQPSNHHLLLHPFPALGDLGQDGLVLGNLQLSSS